MARIYISYNHHDAEIASQFANALKSFGHEVSIDVDELQAGQEWRRTLFDALKESDGLVVLLTPNSISSSYVLTEIGSARAFIQESKRMFLIPVIIGEMPLPPVVNDLHCLTADPNNLKEVFAKLRQSITAYIDRRAA